MESIAKLIRPNILNLEPYSSARDEYSGAASVFLDANESPYNDPYNRYPDPYQTDLKNVLSKIKSVSTENIFLGNGSDEPIDLLFRTFCEPGKDNVVSIHPTYGMYQVAADINNIPIKKVSLTADYQLDVDAILASADANSKLLFICSPNNPTGNSFPKNEIEKLLQNFKGIVVLDEAYIDFAPEKSFLPELNKYPNLVILQTLSKAWGLAGIRLGMAFADAFIIKVLSKVKYPYNINILTQQKALETLKQEAVKNRWVETTLAERSKVCAQLEKTACVEKVYPSDANFVLAKVNDAKKTYDFLLSQEIIVRNRTKIHLCGDCIRITIGSPSENETLIQALQKI